MLDLLRFHGVEVPDNSKNGQHVCTCPFTDCGSPKFHVNAERQLWDCKKCGREGNQYTFLTMLHEHHLEDTTEDNYEALAKQRPGITVDSLMAAKFAYDGDRWMVPYQNGSEFLNNLGAFRPDYGFRIFKTPGLPLKLYRPTNPKDLPEKVVIVEGEWDLLAIIPHLPPDHGVVAVPGALTFKEEFIPNFRGKRVILLYDRDDSGKKGIAKATRMLNNVAESIQFLAWPEDLEFHDANDKDKQGKDIRDLVVSLT